MAESRALKIRDGNIDVLKGVLMILVIWGHAIGQLGSGFINEHLQFFIYLFHMPVFILISGYFMKYKGLEHMKISILKLLVPLIIFQVINAICLKTIGDHLGLDFWIIPYWTLWYLLSLIFWRLIGAGIYKINKRICSKVKIVNIVIIGITIIAAIFSGIMYNGRILSIQRTINFLPFFLLGFLFRDKLTNHSILSVIISYTIIAITLIACFLGAAPLQYDYMYILWGGNHYCLSEIWLKAILYVISIVVSLCVWQIFTNRGGKKQIAKRIIVSLPPLLRLKNRIRELVSFIGRKSLFFYLYHGLIIKFLIQPLQISLKLPGSFGMVLVYVVVTIVIVSVIYQIKPLYKLVYPFGQ